ncbi:MAG: tripartite tricarboxylate transporter substrate binding protein, partial [Xanthobacteraceae bacterium]
MSWLRLRWLLALGLVVALSVAANAPSASADDWSTRPVRLILTLGPGSGADIGARLLADKLSQRWGQPVIVDNRPGGDGIVAMNAFVSAHDDHILLFTPTSSFTAHPYLHDHLPYKPSDLVPITRVSNTFVAVSVPTALNVDSLAKLVALAKEKPGQLNWAGLTGALDFLLAGWLQEQNLNIAKIAYKNPVDAANDLAENRVQLYESAFAIVRPQLQTGKIKVLAVTNTARAPNLPDLPTVAEAGYPGLTVDGLVGIFGPAGISEA